MLKICFLSSMHPENDKRVFDKEALTLLDAGHEIIHLCPGKYNEERILQGVKTITYTRSSTITSRIVNFFSLLKKAKSIEANVYHCNEVDSWFIGLLLKAVTGRKVVFDVHEHYPSTFAESRFPLVLRPTIEFLIRTLFRLLTPFTDKIVLAKKSVSQDFHCSKDKKVLVRNFTLLSAINFSNNRNNSNDNFTMIHLGLIGTKRGWPQILTAMSIQKHRTTKVKFIGEFNDNSRNDFNRTVTKLGLNSRVEFYDWMPFQQAFSHLQDANIGLITFQPGIKNHTYAMPHKMFDYMAAGLPVICPGFAEEIAPIIESTHSGLLVDTSSPEDLAQKFDYLFENRDVANEMGESGIKAVSHIYNWEAEATRLIKMYEIMYSGK